MEQCLILDSNGYNPYGAELAAALSSHMSVRLIHPRDATHPGGSVRVRAVLHPTVFEGRWATTEVSALHDLVRAALCRVPIIVVYARNYHKVILLLLALMGARLFVLAHNPGSSRWPTGWRAAVESSLLRRSAVVVHGKTLRDALPPELRERAHVIGHVPYTEWVSRTGARRVPGDPAELRLVMLGRSRPDKWTPEAVEQILDEMDRSGVECVIRMCTRPRYAAGWPYAHIRLIDDSSDRVLDDHVIARALRSSDLLIAPYAEVTDSGTVRLAITAGLGVVAFDGGNLGSVLASKSLVRTGAAADFAARCVQFHLDPWDSALVSADAWRESVLADWLTLLHGQH
jgi:hypothetical protein